MKNKIIAILLLVFMVFTYCSFTQIAFADVNDVNATMDKDGTLSIATGNDKVGDEMWTDIFTRYKNVITGIAGVAALTFLVFFIINFMKLGQSAGNPQLRSQALLGIVWCGIACAGLGGVAIFFGFFYNMFKSGK